MSRLEGVKKGGWFARLVFQVSRWKLGKVVTPLRIHAYSTPVLFGFGQMQTALEAAKTLDPKLKLLAQLRVAQRIGCPF